MHGHFCLHDLIVFLTMVWEGLSCCLMCGRTMFKVACDRFKNKVKHRHYVQAGRGSCPTCIGESHRAQYDP